MRARAWDIVGVSAAVVAVVVTPWADAPASQAEEAAAPLQWMGRVDASSPGGPRFAWPGTAVSVRFSGSSLAVRLKDEGSNAFEVIVDGAAKGVLFTGPSRELYPIASGLDAGDHEATLVKRTEALFGEVQLLGFVPSSEGALGPASAWRPARRIELVGDSITAGYGDEGTTPTCPFSASTENELAAYGAIAARALGAEHATLAWSGKTVAGMAALYDRALPGRADSRWDAASWVPDAVVINLGTNDMLRSDAKEDSFVAAFDSLVARVRAAHPRAFIVCALGPMLTDGFPSGGRRLSHARAYLQAVVEHARAAGDARVELLEFPTQDTTKAGCGFHPGLAAHRAMADQLAALLRSRLGW
ncbi:MAG TPA: SGNH/GDSL hydrolase family protein [Polyangiaceae bacterium]